MLVENAGTTFEQVHLSIQNFLINTTGIDKIKEKIPNFWFNIRKRLKLPVKDPLGNFSPNWSLSGGRIITCNLNLICLTSKDI